MSWSLWTKLSRWTTGICQLGKQLQQCAIRPLSISSRHHDLMELFDSESNWGKSKVLVGRPWQVAELRLKSNSDLHKLWYVLLKERNMLMTMEAEYKRIYERMPNPERIYKVDESMENLLTVVEERNRAYQLLEVGPEHRRREWKYNLLGLRQLRRLREHPIPYWLNKSYLKATCPSGAWVKKCLKLWRQKQIRLANDRNHFYYKHRRRMVERFPHLDIEQVKVEDLGDVTVDVPAEKTLLEKMQQRVD